MIDINRYIVNGSVKRDRIVADIKRGRISKKDILELDKNPVIREEYFECKKLNKVDRTLWNNKYLDELSLVSVSESFGKEYLLYLCDVAEYVIHKERKKEKNSKVIKGILIGVVGILFIFLVIAFIGLKARKDTISITSIALTRDTYLCLVKGLR